MRRHRSIAVGLGAVLCACASGEPVTTCEDERGIHVVCGFQNPEDLALLPDGRRLVVSQFGAMDGTRPGNLAVFDTVDETLSVVYRGATGGSASPGWGSRDCPGPPAREFAPHGIDLARRPDGRLQLLVVNHGGREAIEFFEVTEGDEIEIAWRGCAVPAAGAFMNDVVHLPDGGFLVTHMMDPDAQGTSLLRAAFGSDTGYVLRGAAAGGFEKLAGSDGPFPNGIELAPDGASVWVNLYMAGEVRRIDLATGELISSASIASPDNSSWASDGSLLVASHLGGLGDQLQCQRLEAGACPMEFQIVALDPGTLEQRVVFHNQGPPMGAGTVAVEVEGQLWIGSFAGDRMIRVPFTAGD